MRHLPVTGRRISIARIAFAAAALLASTFLAEAQEARPLRGVAMVIGNSDYRNLPALANPANDARAVEMLLSSLGFETELSSDRDARRLARDLDIFLEDAEGADVAVLYYAGHGIEAGGQNFLVPVDADLTALDAAGEKLVPISAFVEQLQATVPVVIVMLDACRDNPFPAGSTVRLDGGSEPLPMGEGGLGETRGAARIAPAGARPAENYGTVIAFAAEPGHAALDGEPGGNSPYTAAVLRHLETMAGEEFGLVMRMVAEEVYLKTAGRQRPWVNESLRRLLYFGAAPEPTSGTEGDILTERRQLLITISALPMQGRDLVERVAGDGGVPMDALFAMLNTLGEDLPDDPAELDRLLRRLADDLKGVLEERSALRSTDPEIMRLAALAETATAEGALSTAVALYEQAKARVAERSGALDMTEENLRQRRIENAGVYAGSGGTRALALDHRGAAEDFALAAREVERWDEGLNRRYRLAQARALIDHGVIRGDTPALEEAVAILEGLAGTEARTALADALAELGRRQVTSETLERAVAAYRELLDGTEGIDRASTMRKLGAALLALGRRDIGAARLQEAVAALEAARDLVPRTDAPLQWAAAQADLGQARVELWERDRESDALDRAVAHYRAALEEFDAGSTAASWASAQLGLGRALRLAGLRSVGGALPGRYFGLFSSTDRTVEAKALFQQSIDAYDAALEACGRETYPVCWAAAHHGRAVVLYSLGAAERGDENDAFTHFRHSLASFQDALGEQRLDMAPVDWAETHASRAEMLARFADRSADGIRLIYLAEAARGYREALSVITAESLPALWFDINGRLARAHTAMVSAEGRPDESIPHALLAVDYLRASLEGLDPVADRERWRGRMDEIADTLRWRGHLIGSVEPIDEAIAIYASLGDTDNVAFMLDSKGSLLLRQARRQGDPALARTARHTYEEIWLIENRRAAPSRAGIESVLGDMAKADERLASFEPAALELAAAGYRAALARQGGDPKERALARYDLASVLKVLAERTEDDALLEESVAFYRAALEDWTLDADPLRHGLAQEQLGDALFLSARRGGGLPRYREAAAAYEAALAGLTREAAPFDWARLNRKLADRLNFSIGRPTEDLDALRRAVAHYHAAMEVDTAEDNPGWYTGMQTVVGDILVELAGRGEGGYAEAVEAYRLAASPRTPEDDTDWWTQNEAKIADALVKHADALLNEGEPAGDMDRVRETLAHFEAAVEIYAGQQRVVDEAYAKAGYGRALYALGEAGLDVALLEKTVTVLREGMAALDREEHSGYWAWAYEKIGFALNRLSEIDGRAAGEAVAAFREVQALRPREADAWGWAAATHSIAYSMILEARAGNADVDFEEVLALSRSTVEVFAEENSALAVALTGSVQCMGLTGLARVREDPAPAREAVETCERALPVIMAEGSALAKRHVQDALDDARAAVAGLEGEN